MSEATIFIQEQFHLTDIKLELLAGLLSIYSFIGAVFAGQTSDLVGRCYVIVVARCFFFAGAILMGFSTNYAFLMVVRLVAGIDVSFAMMISPVYTIEVTPSSMHGFLTSFIQVFINIGILLRYMSNYVFARLPAHLDLELGQALQFLLLGHVSNA
ncbi:hypothetical protein K2173_000243 [Erythroxylum novogranatense]|uniref:Major facilitator superfamily (MFS) profile domain-containing protein n=1 Tax=Erythroxylum novogranatense TaxID=1862640 RepID=A0AAV8SVX8_9ROSI|nr:hypothetical protein K2173_000243 [Erythroxylum novogranatense]